MSPEAFQNSIAEMWDAYHQLPDEDPNKSEIFKQCQEIERLGRRRVVLYLACQAVGPELHKCLTDNESPQLWNIEWLSTLLNALQKDGSLQFLNPEDPVAAAEMLMHVEDMLNGIRKALQKVKEAVDG